MVHTHWRVHAIIISIDYCRPHLFNWGFCFVLFFRFLQRVFYKLPNSNKTFCAKQSKTDRDGQDNGGGGPSTFYLIF